MVRLTLQSNIGEKTQNRTVAIQKCGDPPYEVALRFAGCCLRCGACFAAGYSWPEKVSSNKRVVADVPIERLVEDFDTATTGKPPFNSFRVLGGEPLLNDEYINYLFDFLVCIAKHAERFRNSVIIQTNGIHVGRGNTTVLGKRLEELYQVNPDVLVVIETSIKGTNPDEFALVARSPKSLFEYNLNSYYELLQLGLPNLRPTLIAGFGINESYLLNKGKSEYRITLTRDGHTPIYHESQWSDEFRGLYDRDRRSPHLSPIGLAGRSSRYPR